MSSSMVFQLWNMVCTEQIAAIYAFILIITLCLEALNSCLHII